MMLGTKLYIKHIWYYYIQINNNFNFNIGK